MYTIYRMFQIPLNANQLIQVVLVFLLRVIIEHSCHTHLCHGCRNDLPHDHEAHIRVRGCLALSAGGRVSVLIKHALDKIEIDDVLMLCQQAQHTLMMGHPNFYNISDCDVRCIIENSDCHDYLFKLIENPGESVRYFEYLKCLYKLNYLKEKSRHTLAKMFHYNHFP